ncbi:hypothetical protein [Mycolicibacter senuensis]|uniref:hypothetical protein n=1 Tax=Mycolicibacter senuensis TaxID=386913 RepID=UPI001402413E|nr:hypothetical protein [Mycolicibacter senuensis]
MAARVRHRREGDMPELDWELLQELAAGFGADADAHHYGTEGSTRTSWSHLSKAGRT